MEKQRARVNEFGVLVKTCKQCDETKPLKSFGKKGKTSSGSIHWSAYCSKCHKDRRIAYLAKYRSVPEHREKAIAYSSNYNQRFKSQAQADFLQKIQAENGHKVCHRCFRHLPISSFHASRIKSDGHKHVCKNCRSAEARAIRRLKKIILERDGYICYLCKEKKDLSIIEVDHVVPLSRGGTHDPSNLRACCDTCNTRKGNKLLEEIGIIVPPLL